MAAVKTLLADGETSKQRITVLEDCVANSNHDIQELTDKNAALENELKALKQEVASLSDLRGLMKVMSIIRLDMYF